METRPATRETSESLRGPRAPGHPLEQSAVLALDHFDLIAGAQACLIDQLAELHRRGHGVAVTRARDPNAARRLDGQSDWVHLDVFPYLTKSSLAPVRWLDLLRLRQLARPYPYLLANSLPGLLTGMLVKRPEQHLLFQCHRIDLNSVHRSLLRLARPEFILAVSQTSEAYLLELGFPKERVRLVGNGFVVDQFPELPLPGANPDQPVTVGLVARLHREKGVEEFITLAKELAGNGLRFRLLGPVVDPPLIPILDRAVAKGWVMVDPYRDRLVDLYRDVDVVASLSRFLETFGRTVVEGALFGRPAVVLRRGHTPNLLQAGRTGFVAEDLAEFGERLKDLADDRVLLQRMGRAARAEARINHSLEAVVDRLEACLSPHPGGSY
jgi:glycosyltransferase involved in cell wall biosynthesis